MHVQSASVNARRVLKFLIKIGRGGKETKTCSGKTQTNEQQKTVTYNTNTF